MQNWNLFPKEQPLLGDEDAKQLDIVKLNPEGATEEILPADEIVKQITYPDPTDQPHT